MASARERLIEAANRLFYENGFHAVGLDRIIEEVEVTRTTFYNHFESRDDLILAVLQRRDHQEREEWFEEVRRRSPRDPRGQILALFDVVAEWLASPGFKGCMFLKALAEFPSPSDPIHMAAASHGARTLEGVREIAASAGAADPELLASQLMIVLSGAIATGHGHDIAAAETAKATARMLVDHHLPRVGVPA